ncbi:hypothetical protein ASE00_18605 [Sphingomonas sp. Root710]|uniref:MaoC family dehydratase n=1 Tax=Sphingomonas sp. Root710 TaxID=1736594 RepID=UPI0006FECE16|nr:MaoC family dehydratase [Sphingomonas sp. Root710]KRB79726.1 hypothetical protein ASE00_18605 [Sphingomonas sp. Root710]
MPAPLSLDQYAAKVGQELGVSDWFLIDQPRITAFADITEDHQFIHVDPEAAAATPFGGTIAHGFLILSMMSAMSYSAVPGIEGAAMTVNYGMNAMRFVAPVRAGKRVRGRFSLVKLAERAPGQWQTTIAATVEIEGEDKPAVVAEWVGLHFL